MTLCGATRNNIIGAHTIRWGSVVLSPKSWNTHNKGRLRCNEKVIMEGGGGGGGFDSWKVVSARDCTWLDVGQVEARGGGGGAADGKGRSPSIGIPQDVWKGEGGQSAPPFPSHARFF